jgi:hypothetical protein
MPNWHKKKLISSALFIIFAILGIEIALSYGNHKMIMPGDYFVTLSPGQYAVWSFNRWSSRGFDLPLLPPTSLSITDPEGAPVKLERWAIYGQKYSDWNIEGGIFFLLDIHRAGVYRVRSQEKGVIALIPTKRMFMDLGNNPMFWGMDDFGFENRLR